MDVIKVHNLEKQYKGADFKSLKGVSLTIQKGEIFGLLGPNGAGKTTLISILCGLLSATNGEVFINDKTYASKKDELRKLIGVVPQEYALYPSLTARENLMYFGGMYGIAKQELKSKVITHLEALGLAQFADKKIRTFSGGMKRRVNLIAAILHQPEILFLDEPTVGVDVQSKKAITQKLEALNQSGTTIIYTSHHLREAQELCTRVGIIDKGEIIVSGSPDKLIAEVQDARNLEDVFVELTGKEFRDYA
ncbi:ABC transporter ATP-binding protein [Aquimarina rhabdastrellae]